MDSDFLLVQKMKNGNEDALEKFVRKYYPAIHWYQNKCIIEADMF